MKTEFQRPFVIGVTGRIACGKSSVLAQLGEKGAETIDADRVYHELIRPNMPLWHALREQFGRDIVGNDDEIDRRVLGRIVFSDTNALRRLDEITHPAITEELIRRIAGTSADVIAVDAVKLVESGMDKYCDAILRVQCPPNAQIKRLRARNQLSADEAKRRIGAQSAPPHSLQPEITIDNSDDLNALRARVDAAWAMLFPAHRI